MTNSTISDNTAGYAGGGISVSRNPGPMTVINSTISGNTNPEEVGGGGGGGISADFGCLTIINSTISGNTTLSGNGGYIALDV